VGYCYRSLEGSYFVPETMASLKEHEVTLLKKDTIMRST
jgi:hypothetical protein